MTDTFAHGLPESGRGFVLRMDEILTAAGLIVRYGERQVTYYPDTNRKQPGELKKLQPLVLRFALSEGALSAELKLNFVDCYSGLIEKMPERIKAVLRSIRRCYSGQEACDRPWVDGSAVWIDGSPNCGLRRTYTLDGERYHLCSYKFYYSPDISNPEDVKYYAEIIMAEVAAAKARKKHNTSWHDEQGEKVDKPKIKEIITEDTVIGSRIIAAAEFRRFFKKALGEDYEKHPLVMDVVKMSSRHKGRALKEIVEECIHPSGQTFHELTRLDTQKRLKPAIEEVIPHILGAGMQNSALELAGWLRENKMSPGWSGVHNAWDAQCRGKNICKISLIDNVQNRGLPPPYNQHNWAVTIYLENINSYEEAVVREGMQDFIWDNVGFYCESCRPCAPGMDIVLLGRQIKGICVGRKFIRIWDPDSEAVSRIKRLLALEKQARGTVAE